MRPPIKVMHILQTLRKGGLEKGVVNLTNHLKSKGYETSICCLEESGVFEQLLDPGTKVFVMGKLPGIDYTLPLRLAKLFRREKTMIVHTHNLGTYLYGALGAKLVWGTRVVHGEHGFQTSECRMRHLVARRYLSYVTDAIHTVSADLKNTLVCMTKINPGRITPILNGVELGKYNVLPNPQLRTMLGIQPEEFVIGTVSRLTPVKNFELLIQVMPEVNRNGIHAKVLFVGDGHSRPNLESLARRFQLEERVIFLGERSDVPELLNVMDIFVLPSFSEGLSNSILEAMATGLPVIASNVGGNPESVIHNQTGFLFPSQDADMLTQRIVELASDPEKRLRMGTSGRTRVEELFTLQKMVQNYEQLYRNVLRSRR